jgi:hypothetical protein
MTYDIIEAISATQLEAKKQPLKGPACLQAGATPFHQIQRFF